MNDKLKKYVNAYMDGEEVEYRNDHNTIYYPVTTLQNFEIYNHFRIKPKAEDKWQRVIDEGYLCKFWNDDMDIPEYRQYGTLIQVHTDTNCPSFISFRDNCDSAHDNCEILREKGIKQPYFQGDDIPVIDGNAVIYFKDGDIAMEYAVNTANIIWSEVVAYIEV